MNNVVVVTDLTSYAGMVLIQSGMIIPIAVWFLAFVGIMMGMQKYVKRMVNNFTILIAAALACVPAWASIHLFNLPFIN